MAQPDNGIPIIPYYHYNKDRELPILLEFLREVVSCEDVRKKLRGYFFWYRYVGACEADA
jgi:hypothetical protein